MKRKYQITQSSLESISVEALLSKMSKASATADNFQAILFLHMKSIGYNAVLRSLLFAAVSVKYLPVFCCTVAHLSQAGPNWLHILIHLCDSNVSEAVGIFSAEQVVYLRTHGFAQVQGVF